MEIVNESVSGGGSTVVSEDVWAVFLLIAVRG
jgi:hypothetical protein